MKAADLKDRLVRHTIEHSGHDTDRTYLGMSQIDRREDDLVREMVTGERWRPTDDQHLMLHLGRVFEASVQDRLWDLGLLVENSEERELVAGFDERFRGHIDGEILDRAHGEREPECFDVKCISQFELQKRTSERRARDKDFAQMQMYVHHGGYERGHIIYVSRESGQIYVHEVRPVRSLIDALNAKARRVLAAVDEARRAAA